MRCSLFAGLPEKRRSQVTAFTPVLRAFTPGTSHAQVQIAVYRQGFTRYSSTYIIVITDVSPTLVSGRHGATLLSRKTHICVHFTNLHLIFNPFFFLFDLRPLSEGDILQSHHPVHQLVPIRRVYPNVCCGAGTLTSSEFVGREHLDRTGQVDVSS